MAKRTRDEDEDEYVKRPTTRANTGTKKPATRQRGEDEEEDENEEDEKDEDEDEEEKESQPKTRARAGSRTSASKNPAARGHDEEEEKEEDEEEQLRARNGRPKLQKRKGTHAELRAEDDDEDEEDAPPPAKRPKLDMDSYGGKSAPNKRDGRPISSIFCFSFSQIKRSFRCIRITAGVLAISPPNDPTPVTGCITYIRIAQAQNGAEAAINSLLSSPADAPYSFVRLVELGASPKDLKDVFDKAFEDLAPDAFPDKRLSTYSGTTIEKQPSGRQEDDQAAARKNQLPSRFGRWLSVNDSDVRWVSYRIVELCLPASPGVRTDPVAACCEQFSIAMQIERGLNSQGGGFIRLFEPSLPSSPKSPRPSTARIASPPLSLTYAIKNVAGVSRSNRDTIPYLRIMKDNTAEDLRSEDKAPWQANTGKGLQEFRHILRILEPRIPERGDIPERIIAAHVGPSMDFFRLVSGTLNFWFHTLGTSTLLVSLKPVVISTHSNAVFAAVGLGYLHLVWRGFPEAVVCQILSARIPPDVVRHLPAHEDPFWHPTCSDGAYLDSVGTLLICRYGRDELDLALVIPNLDPGVSKYRGRESVFAETILTLVSAIDNIAVALVQQLHDAGRMVAGGPSRWSRGAAGLRAELDEAKAAYRRHTEVVRHLEHMRQPVQRNSPLSRADDYEIPGITHASASGAARVDQYEFFITYIDELIANGLSERAFVLVPSEFRDDIKSDGFRQWFLKLKPGIRISNSARTLGNTPEARANALRSREALPNNKAALSAGGKASAAKSKAQKDILAIPANMLKKMLEDTGDLIKNPPFMQKEGGSLSLAHTHRWCVCPNCPDLVLASDQNHTHTSHRVPSRYPGKRPLLPPCSAYNPVPIIIESIFATRANRKLAKSVFSAFDLSTHPLPFDTFKGSIWVAKDSANPEANATLHVASALDRFAASLSRCPAHLLPATAEDYAKAWAGDVLKIVKGDQNYFVMRCAFGHFQVMSPRTGPYFDHSCPGTYALRPVDPATGRRPVGSRYKGGDRDCKTQQWHEVKTTFDLPPEHIRRLIHRKLIVPEQTLREPQKRKRE
ncbi:hypothetical protein C8R45DRAFT_1150364 [Mycena sanguinolenta]|nr:hypothetical protein C8R45DRAFT_1150364 [Mycena sanguinolenta]